jgi:hypothetical protein
MKFNKNGIGQKKLKKKLLELPYYNKTILPKCQNKKSCKSVLALSVRHIPEYTKKREMT